ncbi:MAG: DUF1684 domain-containing protein [Chloroflexi bacterium]|nr:DUF1684 domain-containing protein [Chloroflexota bacterium]
MDADALREFRREKDLVFKSHVQSPLTPEQRRDFKGLDYYPPNPDLDLVLAADEFDEKITIQMQTTTGGVQSYQKWGQLSFEVKGETATLVLYYTPEHDHFFLPFMDATSGQTTYSGGRYLDPARLDDGRFGVDFNRAYAPYCAYNEYWTCPIPPLENRLEVPIEAGEKAFKHV